MARLIRFSASVDTTLAGLLKGRSMTLKNRIYPDCKGHEREICVQNRTDWRVLSTPLEMFDLH